MSGKGHVGNFAFIDTVAALDVFARLSYERGPNVRELQVALGLSSESIAHYRFKALEAAGWVERVPLHPGEYRLTPLGREAAGATAGAQKGST